MSKIKRVVFALCFLVAFTIFTFKPYISDSTSDRSLKSIFSHDPVLENTDQTAPPKEEPVDQASFVINATIPPQSVNPEPVPSIKIYHPHKRLDYSVAPFKGDIKEQIPKRIWTFWESEDPPKFLELCWKGWSRLNPDHELVVLNRSNWIKYISQPVPSNMDSIRVSFKSDWIRLAVLKEHGGIWMDASIILTTSLAFVHEKQQESQTEGFMYFLNGWTFFIEYPLYESWFIATIPNGKFITAWFNEFNHAVDQFSLSNEYLETLKSEYGEQKYLELLQGNSMPDYLKVHMALQKVIQIDQVSCVFAESAESDAYKIHSLVGWNEWEVVRHIIAESVDNVPKLVKLRGGERNNLLNMISNGDPIHPNSIYAKFVQPTTLNSTTVNTSSNSTELNNTLANNTSIKP